MAAEHIDQEDAVDPYWVGIVDAAIDTASDFASFPEHTPGPTMTGYNTANLPEIITVIFVRAEYTWEIRVFVRDYPDIWIFDMRMFAFSL